MENDSTHQPPIPDEVPCTGEKMSQSEIDPLVIPPESPQSKRERDIKRVICVHRARWVQSLNSSIDYWLTIPSTAVNFYVFLNLAQHAITVPQAAKLLRLGGIIITRIFANGAMPLGVTVRRILSRLECTGEAENFAILLQNNGFRRISRYYAAELMEELSRFLPTIRTLEKLPAEMVKEAGMSMAELPC